jgi:hypothetical protein
MIQVITAYKPHATDRSGQRVNEGSEIPVFKGARLSTNQQLRKLDDALEYLADTSCSFWACKGPTRPRHMCTCVKCYAMREVAIVRASIARKA